MRLKPRGQGYAWVILVAGTLGMFITIPASPPGLAPYVDYLLSDLEISRGLLSGAFLVGTVSAGFLMPWAGRLIDRNGSRKTAMVGMVGLSGVLVFFGALGWIATILGGLLGQRELFLLVFLTLGFGALRVFGLGVVMNASRTMIFRWFVRRRGLAAGLNGMILSVMFSASPIVLNLLIEVFGWRESWYILAAMTATLGVIGVAMTFWDSPESCGIKIDREVGRAAEEGLGGDGDEAAGDGGLIEENYTVREARRTAAFWIFNFGLGVNVIIGTGVAFNIVSVGAELGGMGRDAALQVFLPSAIFNVITVLLVGSISGRIRMRYVHYLMMMAQMVNLLGILQLDTTHGFWMFVVGNGIAWGAFGVMISVPWPRFYGRRHLGEINGVVTAVTVIASGLGPPAFGVIFEVFGSYLPILLVSFILTLLAGVLGGLATNPRRRGSK